VFLRRTFAARLGIRGSVAVAGVPALDAFDDAVRVGGDTREVDDVAQRAEQTTGCRGARQVRVVRCVRLPQREDQSFGAAFGVLSERTEAIGALPFVAAFELPVADRGDHVVDVAHGWRAAGAATAAIGIRAPTAVGGANFTSAAPEGTGPAGAAASRSPAA